MNETHERLSAELTGLEQQLNEHAAKGLEQELAGGGDVTANPIVEIWQRHNIADAGDPPGDIAQLLAQTPKHP